MIIIESAEHPYVNKLALPGGFYKPDDLSLEYAASRELLEETSVSIDITPHNLIKVTSTKGRDPRGWVISVAYKVIIDETTVKPLANSDAIYANFVELNTLKKEDLAFDHWEIIEHARVV